MQGEVRTTRSSGRNNLERFIEYDFEKPIDETESNNYSDELAHTGNYSYHLDPSQAYSPVITRRVADVIDTEFKLITSSVWINAKDDDPNVLLVFTLMDANGKEYFWKGQATKGPNFSKGEWVKLRAQYKLPFEL